VIRQVRALLARTWPVAILAAVAGCAGPAPVPAPIPPPSPPFSSLTLIPARFADLPGWTRDRQADAIPALARSCRVLTRSAAGPRWQAPCAALSRLKRGDTRATRAYLKRWFRPYVATSRGSATGLFTAYYEPEVNGSRYRHGRYTVPLLARPGDLVIVQRGHKRLVGRMRHGTLVPYPSRARILAGALGGQARPLFWLDDPVAAAILQIQGSGRVRLPDGSVHQVGVAATNGRTFVGLGRILAQRGVRTAPNMPAIRAWLHAHPRQARSVLNANPRYVFYRLVSGPGPVGTEGVALTPGRSLAVDRRFVPLGTPLWLDTTGPDHRPIRRLVIAQDTGGAIHGGVRGDLYWGSGETAFASAGRMKAAGRYWVLLPRGY
jgi:membrane-bound lytic murein transglycosylase A